jgi:hypothetical protein
MTPAEYRAASPSDRLRAIADAMQSNLYMIATLEDEMVKLQGGEWSAERASLYRALAAGESLISHLLALGIDAKTSGRALPAWLPPLLGQINSAFVADIPPPVLRGVDA